jgi:ribosomal-protein-serine acetyltransferase
MHPGWTTPPPRVARVLSLQIDDARLSDLEPWHAEQLAALFRAHGSDFYDWLPWEGFEDVEGARGFLESFAKGRGEGTRRLYGIWVDDELVGGTLFPSINARSRTAEAGVFLAASARGRGIVTRAVAAMLDWAFVERGLHRVEWRCAPNNLASRRVAERLGFTHEGTLHEVFPVREERQDLEVWALLDREWSGLPPRP